MNAWESYCADVWEGFWPNVVVVPGAAALIWASDHGLWVIVGWIGLWASISLRDRLRAR